MTDNLYKQAQQALATFIHKRDAAAEKKWQALLEKAEVFIREHIRPRLLEAVNNGEHHHITIPYDTNQVDDDMARAVALLLKQNHGFPDQGVNRLPEGAFVLTIRLDPEQQEPVTPAAQSEPSVPHTVPDTVLAARYNNLLSRKDVNALLDEMADLQQRYGNTKASVEAKVPNALRQRFNDDNAAWSAFAQAAAHRLSVNPASLQFDPDLGLITFTFPKES